MNLRALSLTEIAAIVAEHLENSGIEVVVVGGSAITSWASQIYTSADIDFTVANGSNRRAIAKALAEIGFTPAGRIFTHPDCKYTLDFVGTSTQIDGRVVIDFAEIRTTYGRYRVLHLGDAIADRISHFVHWSDSEALDIADRTTSAMRERLTLADIERAFAAIQAADKASQLRLDLARRRLLAAFTGDPQSHESNR